MQEAGYDFIKEMQVFDPNDRNSIYVGLRRVYDYDNEKINRAIAEQVLCSACDSL